jgi:hypothetical protein
MDSLLAQAAHDLAAEKAAKEAAQAELSSPGW